MRISIVTVTYNAAAVLPGLIQSLRAQVDNDFEWVVADGGSTDGTVELLRGVTDIPMTWQSEPDFGIYDAINKAVKLCQGEFYLVAGADDVLDPMAIANYKTLILSSGADIVTAPVQHAGLGLIGPPKGGGWLRGASAFITWHSVGTVYRKSLHEKERIGFYSRAHPIAADSLFTKRAAAAGAHIVVGDFVAGHIGGDGVSSANVAGALTDLFRVQLETESAKGLQVLLFIGRLICNFRRLCR